MALTLFELISRETIPDVARTQVVIGALLSQWLGYVNQLYSNFVFGFGRDEKIWSAPGHHSEQTS